MTIERQLYEKGFEKCSRCGCLRPSLAMRWIGDADPTKPDVRICRDADAGFCIETAIAKQRAAAVSFPKGGGK